MIFYELWNRLPKKYRDRLRDFYEADGLIDDCKYILEIADHYSWNGYPSVPVRSLTEAIQFMRETEYDAELPTWGGN